MNVEWLVRVSLGCGGLGMGGWVARVNEREGEEESSPRV